MTALAQQHQAVNLGQGFPDFDGPDAVKEAAIEAIRAGKNQYARSAGVPELVRAIADHQERFYGLSYDALSEVTVYSGATEAIACTLQALLEIGDEIVMFEPFYDSYRACVAMAGGVVKGVTLESPEFGYDPKRLEAAITPRTRAILLNTPHNPTGKVFSESELAHVAEMCAKYDLVAITDEVYEHLVFSGRHLSLASMPGMRDRTVTISSAGKTFSLTGWKVGWTCAAPALTVALRAAHQFTTFATNTPAQYAVAVALQLPDSYFDEFLTEYRARKDLLVNGLSKVGFGVCDPAGTYFVCADIRPLGFSSDAELCRRLPVEVGVAAIPNSAFYENPERGSHLVRFAFCKSTELLAEGVARLADRLPRLNRSASSDLT